MLASTLILAVLIGEGATSLDGELSELLSGALCALIALTPHVDPEDTRHPTGLLILMRN